MSQVMSHVMSQVIRDLPDDPRVRPAADGAMQPHTLLLPHGVGARFDHKVRGVHQAVFVHALEMFPVFMDLENKKFFSLKKPSGPLYCHQPGRKYWK